VLKRGRKIDDDSPPELLHRLRIDCKKLRYLLEFFAELYPAKRIRPMIGALKKLQNCLGDYNDLTVELQSLARIVERLPADDNGPESGPVRHDIEELRVQLRQRQAETRARFGGQFAAFTGEDVVSGFRELFGGAGP
jgi:CHAD domain-containing protein